MPVLADTPTLAQQLAEHLTHDRTNDPTHTTAAVPAGVKNAWNLLNPDTPAHTSGRGGPWVLAREEAERSQYVAMQQHLANGGELPDALAVVAVRGRRFVGQRGRSWQAVNGNLHLSVHQQLDLDAASTQVPLALLPAIATARAIERASEGRVQPRTKWVNDLLLEGRKVAGVLSATNVHGGRVKAVIYGIGVNVAHAPEIPAAARVPVPGALADAHPVFATSDAWMRLLPLLLEELQAARQRVVSGAGAALLDDYRARAAFLGRRVSVWPVDDDRDSVQPLARGVVVRLNDDLSLQLEGVSEPIRHGRMTIDG